MEQYTNLQDFESYLWNNSIPIDQFSQAFEQLVALTCADAVSFLAYFFVYYYYNC